MTPIGRHSKGVAESGVGTESRSADEHFLLSHVLEKAVCVDQLCVMNLICLELVVRRLVLLKEAHSNNPSHPNFEGAEHWLGLGERRAGVLIPPRVVSSRCLACRRGDRRSEGADEGERREEVGEGAEVRR